MKQLAGGFGFFNWTIDTPPGTTKAFTGDCRLENDATVFGLARHTHQWGRDFSTWFAGGARDGEFICGPIVQCSEKGGDCQAVISDHSKGLGLAQQVSACVGARCSDTCISGASHHH